MLDFCRILTEAQQGEAAAIEAIFLEFEEDVRFVCLDFQLENTVDLSRSDLSQEAWIRIWVQMDRFQIQENSSNVKQQFRVWLRQIARNEMLRVLEKRHAKKRCPPTPVRNGDCLELQPLGDHSPSERFRQDDEMINLKMAIQRLDAISRAVIESCFLGGRTVKEMADKLGLTYSEARTRLSKALAELKTHLSDPNH
jgi:RNA polymerase sigma factor (sigma-70 family)